MLVDRMKPLVLINVLGSENHQVLDATFVLKFLQRVSSPLGVRQAKDTRLQSAVLWTMQMEHDQRATKLFSIGRV